MSVKKTLLSDVVVPESQPLDTSPKAIAIAQILKLSRQIDRGENLNEAAEALEAIASIATSEFWRLKYEAPEVLESIARTNTSLPVNVSPIALPYDNRSAKEKVVPFEVAEALELPIGEGLKFKVRGDVGKRGPSHDHLYYLIRDELENDFRYIRSKETAESGLEKQIQSLPDLSMENLNQWGKALVDYFDSQNRPYDDPNTWMYQICAPRAETILNASKKERIETLNRRLEARGGEDAKYRAHELHQIESKSRSLFQDSILHEFEKIEAEVVDRELLGRAFREVISVRLKVIVKS